MNRDNARGYAARALVCGVLVAFSSLIVSTPALADPAAATAAPAGTSGEYGGGLEEIIVTATRRAESVQNVPISIQAFAKDELSQGYIKSIDDISALTPGLQFAVPNGFSSAFTTISIRGLNTNTGPPTVGLYLDDTVISSRLSGTANQGNVYPIVWDLERIEVNRGPQGTLFGAGAEAGAVRFIQNQPSLTNSSGIARADLSETEGGRLSYVTAVAYGGPIIQDELGFRASVWNEQDGGWVNRVDPITGDLVSKNANTMDKFAAKLAFAYEIAGVRITPGVFYQNVHQDDARRFYEVFSDAQAGIFNNGVLLPEVWTDKWTLPSIKVETDFPFAKFTGDLSYFNRTATEILDESAFVCPGLQTPPGSGIAGCGSPLGTGYPSLYSQVAYTPTNLYVHAYTAEARMASTTDYRVSWVGGLYWEHRVQRDFQTDYSPYAYPQVFPGHIAPCPELQCSIIQDQHELFVDVQTAAYAQADIKIIDPLTFTAGVRVAHITVNGALTTSIGDLTGAPPWAGFSTSNNIATERGELDYKLDPNNMLYASFGTGFRPGGGNSALPTTGPCGQPSVPRVQATYAPDDVHAFEVGAKDTLLDGRLQINTSIFYNKWNNIQQYVSASCGPYAYGTNAGDAVSDGFDMQIRAIVTQELKADVNVGYVNAYYSKSGYIPGYGPGSPLLAQGQAPLSIVLQGDKVGILPQVNAPWNVSASLDYELPLSNGDKFHAWVNTLYTSQNPGPFITQNTVVNYYGLAVADPATHLYNTRVGYEINKLDFTLFVNNIGNNTPALSKYQANGGSSLITYTTFVPRTVGLSVNYSF
jgi:iron complex outermembrane recepter protein